MKASDTKRAALLCSAIAEWEDLTVALANNKSTRFEMLAGSFDGGCVQPEGSIAVDVVTGAKIAATARAIILSELAALGVEVES